MKDKTKGTRLPDAAEQVKRSGHWLARETRGRARTFTNQKKEASRNFCRSKGE